MWSYVKVLKMCLGGWMCMKESLGSEMVEKYIEYEYGNVDNGKLIILSS